MEKTIMFGDKPVKFSTCFAWVFIYKNQFGKDAAKVLVPAIKTSGGSDAELAEHLYETVGFTGIAEIAWSTAKLADPSIPELMDWIESYGDDFAIDDIMSDLMPDVILSCFTSKKVQAPIKRKKPAEPKTPIPIPTQSSQAE